METEKYKNYKAIFIDIDGTLRDQKRNISNRTIQTIKKVTEKGILVILCSGRPRKYTENISRECFASKYIITSNGGNVYDYKEEKIMYVNIMDKQACLELYQIAFINNNDIEQCIIADRDFEKIKNLRTSIENVKAVFLEKLLKEIGQ